MTRLNDGEGWTDPLQRWSRRLPESLRANSVSCMRARAAVEADLCVSNPTQCGIVYPQGALQALGDSGGLSYAPDPRGRLEARELLAEELGVRPDQVVLTASTSEAYGMLFKLVGDPGAGVLTPAPSYPLIEQLVRLEGLQPVPYRLVAEDGWQPALSVPADQEICALVAVHPNNPTGTFIERDVMDHLDQRCLQAGWLRIVDEVFLEYPLESSPADAGSTVADGRCLTATLGGLSKSCGLPQLKLSWIVLHGWHAEAAGERLVFIADQYLSVGTPVQRALPSLIVAGRSIREQIHRRCRNNLELLKLATVGSAVQVLPVGGGWNAVLRVPNHLDEEELVLTLLERDRVAVYPGYFFDFPSNGWLVVSLLPPEQELRMGIERVVARVEQVVHACDGSQGTCAGPDARE